eukprot:scaffold529_cov308-Pinguiococcus_pyrenoidosus.AAC.30
MQSLCQSTLREAQCQLVGVRRPFTYSACKCLSLFAGCRAWPAPPAPKTLPVPQLCRLGTPGAGKLFLEGAAVVAAAGACARTAGAGAAVCRSKNSKRNLGVFSTDDPDQVAHHGATSAHVEGQQHPGQVLGLELEEEVSGLQLRRVHLAVLGVHVHQVHEEAGGEEADAEDAR